MSDKYLIKFDFFKIHNWFLFWVGHNNVGRPLRTYCIPSRIFLAHKDSHPDDHKNLNCKCIQRLSIIHS